MRWALILLLMLFLTACGGRAISQAEAEDIATDVVAQRTSELEERIEVLEMRADEADEKADRR